MQVEGVEEHSLQGDWQAGHVTTPDVTTVANVGAQLKQVVADPLQVTHGLWHGLQVGTAIVVSK